MGTVKNMRIAYTLCLPRDEASVPVVRYLLGGSLQKLGVSEEDLSDIEIALTEACTNVLRHAANGEDEYDVEIGIEDMRCEISVTDRGHGFDHKSLTRKAGASEERGRGIQLMRALVDGVEFESKPADGTVVHLAKGLHIAPGSPLGRLADIA
jgi:serine/threonine-protein kinase RsbW